MNKRIYITIDIFQPTHKNVSPMNKSIPSPREIWGKIGGGRSAAKQYWKIYDSLYEISNSEITIASHHILGGIFPKLDWCVNFFQSIPCVFHGENVDFDRS